MTPHFEKVQKLLKRLPGLGARSAERIALCLLIERKDLLRDLLISLETASEVIRSCGVCGNICEAEVCDICLDVDRASGVICVIEHAPDLLAIERSEAFYGKYHILQGKLSPINGVGPDDLNLDSLSRRIVEDGVEEVILALSNDMEGEATCYYIQQHIIRDKPVKVTRIGFGLPSGGGVVYADSATLKSALDGRKSFF